jgi:hypothetical protein
VCADYTAQTQIALNFYDVLSFWTHVEQLNYIVGTRTRRLNYVINRPSYGTGCALATRRSICVVRTWLCQCDCYVALSFNRTAPVVSNLHR